MNLRSFLTQVDTITGQMSEDQLKEFFYENARLIMDMMSGMIMITKKSFFQIHMG